jgi:hypothetical protein
VLLSVVIINSAWLQRLSLFSFSTIDKSIYDILIQEHKYNLLLGRNAVGTDGVKVAYKAVYVTETDIQMRIWIVSGWNNMAECAISGN